MEELRTLYRLMILYLLNESDDPISYTQIAGFMLEKEYTNYFVLQETLTNLLDAGLISQEAVPRNTLYDITEEGKKTLSYLQDKISVSIRSDILDFLEHANLFYEEPRAVSSHVKTGDNRYDVTCIIKNSRRTLLKLVISVATEEQADAVCRNWNDQHMNAYTNLLDLLLC